MTSGGLLIVKENVADVRSKFAMLIGEIYKLESEFISY